MKLLLIFGMIMLSSKVMARPHLPLELSLEESQNLWKQFQKNSSLKTKEASRDPEVQIAIDGGEKLLLWLKKINEERAADDQIYLTSSNSRGSGIPIDKPSKYGPKTIKKRYLEFTDTIDKKILEVVYGATPINNVLPIEKKLFIEQGRKISRLYQTAVRWKTSILPWLSWYKRRKRQDVRGYYFLKNLEDLNQVLNGFDNLTEEEQEKTKKALIDICINYSNDLSQCEQDFNTFRESNALVAYKDFFWGSSEAIWNSFFTIRSPRTDVIWTPENPDKMIVPFSEIQSPEIADWLKTNVEDEFKRSVWGMEVKYRENKPGMAYLEFKPNVTPHVSGGNVIVMDANTDINEYSVKWTIRHEFGHILRLPDCYIEFYDEAEEVAVNYQLDVTDLMCSRAGDMNDRIYEELKRVYFKESPLE